MGNSEKDSLATAVATQWLDFQEALSDNRRKYPTREFHEFAQAVRVMSSLRGVTDLSTELLRRLSTVSPSLYDWKENGFQGTSCTKPIGWSACSSGDTIRISRAMSLQRFE
jgi:hypothetical protein